MVGRFHRVLQLLVVAPLFASTTRAQPVITISDNVTCGSCSVRFERILDVGSSRDSVLLTPLSAFGVAPDGMVLASPTSERGTIAVYDRNGRFLRTLGRRGDGPGEFRIVANFAFAGDQVHVLDYGAGKISVFSRDLKLQGTHAIAAPVDGNSDLLVQGDRYLYNVLSIGKGGGTIAVVRGGNLISDTISKPNQSGGAVSASQYSSFRRMGSSGANRFWAAPINLYRLERWTVAGQLEAIVVRDAAWFRPWSRAGPLPWVGPAAPMLTGVRLGPDNLLWVTIIVAKEPFTPAPQGARVGAADMSDFVDTIIEIIDPSSGSLVYSGRFSGERRFVGNDGHIGTFVQDADGIITWTLWRMHLVRPNP
jgi:hypothetical protein